MYGKSRCNKNRYSIWIWMLLVVNHSDYCNGDAKFHWYIFNWLAFCHKKEKFVFMQSVSCTIKLTGKKSKNNKKVYDLKPKNIQFLYLNNKTYPKIKQLILVVSVLNHYFKTG